VIGWLVLVSIERKVASSTAAAVEDPTVMRLVQPSWAARMNP
jgi:hypothetical protein